MSCKTESKQIGDHEFSVTQWPADKALLNKLRLLKAVGPSISKIISDIDLDSKSKESESDNIAAIGSGIKILFECSNPEELIELMKNCIIGVACGDKKITSSSFNEIFSGDNLMDTYKVFIFVLGVNYGNLLKSQSLDKFLAKIPKI